MWKGFFGFFWKSLFYVDPTLSDAMSFFKKFFTKEKKEDLDKGLEKTKTGIFSKISRAVAGKSKVDDDVLDNLEEVLVSSDVGVETTLKIIDKIEEKK